MAGQHSRRPAFFVDVFGADKLFQQADLVVSIQNGEAGLQPRQFRMSAQNFHAQRVECAEPRHPLDHATDTYTDAGFHFFGGFVGEGHRQNFVRAGATCVQQMRDPRGQRLGLTRASASQHQNRPVQRLYRLKLWSVQAV